MGVMVNVLSLVIMDRTPLIKVCAAFRTSCFLSSSTSPSRTLKSRRHYGTLLKIMVL